MISPKFKFLTCGSIYLLSMPYEIVIVRPTFDRVVAQVILYILFCFYFLFISCLYILFHICYYLCKILYRVLKIGWDACLRRGRRDGSIVAESKIARYRRLPKRMLFSKPQTLLYAQSYFTSNKKNYHGTSWNSGFYNAKIVMRHDFSIDPKKHATRLLN